MKPRCKYASPINGTDGKRDCALGHYGGRVSKTDHCQRCTAHVALVAPAAESEAPKEGKSAKPAAPCRFRGDETEPPAGVKRSLRVYVECLHAEQPLGPSVCSCAGCGPKCSGYQLPPAE